MVRQYFEDYCGGVVIPKKDFVAEHTKLLGVLKRGDPAELRAEAKEQAKELRAETGGSKASGFVQRMIAEGKTEKTGSVKKPSADLQKRRAPAPARSEPMETAATRAMNIPDILRTVREFTGRQQEDDAYTAFKTYRDAFDERQRRVAERVREIGAANPDISELVDRLYTASKEAGTLPRRSGKPISKKAFAERMSEDIDDIVFRVASAEEPEVPNPYENEPVTTETIERSRRFATRLQEERLPSKVEVGATSRWIPGANTEAIVTKVKGDTIRVTYAGRVGMKGKYRKVRSEALVVDDFGAMRGMKVTRVTYELVKLSAATEGIPEWLRKATEQQFKTLQFDLKR